MKLPDSIYTFDQIERIINLARGEADAHDFMDKGSHLSSRRLRDLISCVESLYVLAFIDRAKGRELFKLIDRLDYDHNGSCCEIEEEEANYLLNILPYYKQFFTKPRKSNDQNEFGQDIPVYYERLRNFKNWYFNETEASRFINIINQSEGFTSLKNDIMNCRIDISPESSFELTDEKDIQSYLVSFFLSQGIDLSTKIHEIWDNTFFMDDIPAETLTRVYNQPLILCPSLQTQEHVAIYIHEIIHYLRYTGDADLIDGEYEEFIAQVFEFLYLKTHCVPINKYKWAKELFRRVYSPYLSLSYLSQMETKEKKCLRIRGRHTKQILKTNAEFQFFDFYPEIINTSDCFYPSSTIRALVSVLYWNKKEIKSLLNSKKPDTMSICSVNGRSIDRYEMCKIYGKALSKLLKGE